MVNCTKHEVMLWGTESSRASIAVERVSLSLIESLQVSFMMGM